MCLDILPKKGHPDCTYEFASFESSWTKFRELKMHWKMHLPLHFQLHHSLSKLLPNSTKMIWGSGNLSTIHAPQIIPHLLERWRDTYNLHIFCCEWASKKLRKNWKQKCACMRGECEESEEEYKTFGRTNLMISTCSSEPETTGLNIQWENLKPCMPQPHWLLHNHCWGPPHWRFLLSQGGRAFPSTLTELLLLPDDGFSKPQSPFFFSLYKWEKPPFELPTLKMQKHTHKTNERDLHCELPELHFSKFPMFTKWDLTHNLEKNT